MPKNTKQYQLEKQIEKYERACEGADKSQSYKKLDYWTLDEGLKLLIAPNEIGPKSKSVSPSLFDIEFLQNSGKFQTVSRAINKSLPVEGIYDEKSLEYKNSDTKKTVSNYWYYCCAHLKIKPFEFLEFVKDKKLFNIPDELQFSKVRLDSGEYSYFWQDEFSENSDSSNHLNLDNGAELSGKDRQELGRLREEKRTMDATIKAAMEVGKFLKGKIENPEKVIKKDIQDLIMKFDKDLPTSRIDSIWKLIDPKHKKGSGRPSKSTA